MNDHCFISYSTADALDFARKLANELEGGYPYINVWFDKRDLRSEENWDSQLAEAIKTCKCMFFVMSHDSTTENSVCAEEWDWAMRYKKPVVPLRLHTDIEVPFRLGRRQWIDFSGNFEAGLAKLHKYLDWLESPEGILQSLKYRLADGERDLRRARPENEARIRKEIEELSEQIKRQEEIVKNPKAAEEKTEKNIQSGLERERQPEKPVAGKTSTRFINPPPGIAPNYFQDRLIETKQIVDFLNNDAQRLMTIVGRAGVGKTAMVCRLLKALERGELPDDLGEMKADGIVYLSETGSHKVTFANVFADLSKLLPPSEETAERLEGIYKNPQTSTGDKMRAVLDAFPSGRVILLLDNFETLIDPESLSLRDSELSEALNALLGGQHHAVKAVITTRIAPRDLTVSEPGRQHHLSLDEGLESPYAENVLREMDVDGRVGLKTAPDALLKVAREKTRGYPRALEALYAILSVDRYTTLEELFEISLPEEVVQKLVGEAFNRLDPSAQKVMQALAVYNRPVSPAAIDCLLQPCLPSIDSALVLNRLVNMHFARREAGRYYLHPADREYAFSLIPEGERGKTKEERDELRFTQYTLLGRAADYFAQARKPRTEWKKLDDLAAQLAEFELRCEAEDYDTAANVLLEIGFNYLLLWGHYRLALGFYEKVYKNIVDRSVLRGITGDIGTTYLHVGKYQDALNYHGIALQLAEEEGDKSSQAIWINWIANSFLILGQFESALQQYEKSLNLAKEVGHRQSEAVALGSIGNVYIRMGNINKAVEFLDQAKVIFREVHDRRQEGLVLGSLGNAYAVLGDTRKAAEFYEQELAIAREMGNRTSEEGSLGGLGNTCAALGDESKAIEYYEQAMIIAQEIGDRTGESIILENTGHAWLNIGNHNKAEEDYQKAIRIADEISFTQTRNFARYGLAEFYLFQNDLGNARATIEAALQYDVPDNNHNATALYGIITLLQGERETAQEAFTNSIAQADEILAKTPEYYDALDAKGLALSGLAICDLRLTIGALGREELLAEAVKTFRRARKIAPHAGVVKSALRLFDELAKCDEEGILKDVRKVIEGN